MDVRGHDLVAHPEDDEGRLGGVVHLHVHRGVCLVLCTNKKEATLMWNVPTAKQLAALPALYSTEKVPTSEKKLLMHFFIGSSDWWVVEYDAQNKLFFGYAVLNGDWEMAEWGYTSLEELKSIKSGFVEVDRDLHWKPIKFKDLKRGG